MRNAIQRYRQAISCLSPPVRALFSENENRLAPAAREIRLRTGRPLSVTCGDERLFFTRAGTITPFLSDGLFCAEAEDLAQTLRAACEYSVYSRQNEIAEGFVTLRGGHRAGISGTAVICGGKITNIRDLSSFNLRIAGEYSGCADALMRQKNNLENGLLLCGAPCSGKTTLLRDLARQLSYEAAVSLIDERGELAACVGGAPQNDVGLCDVYGGYPKAEAMEQAVRVMSPDYLICDEIGASEVPAVMNCVRCGTAVIAAVHARDPDELYKREALRRLMSTGAFRTAVFLAGRENAGQIRERVSVSELLSG